MTLAHKTKSKTPKIFKKYGNELTLKDQKGKIIATFGKYEGKSFKHQRFNRKDVVIKRDIQHLLLDNLRVARKHMVE